MVWAVWRGAILSCESRELMPASAFVARLLGLSHRQVAFPVCAVAALAVYVSSLLKRKTLVVCIVTDCALSQSVHYAFVPCCHEALLWAVKKIPENFQLSKPFVIPWQNILLWPFCPFPFWEFCLLLAIPCNHQLHCHYFFNTHIQIYTNTPLLPIFSLLLLMWFSLFLSSLQEKCLPPLFTYCCDFAFEGLSQFTKNLLGRKQIQMAAKDCSGYRVLDILDTGVLRSEWQVLLCGQKSHWVWANMMEADPVVNRLP